MIILPLAGLLMFLGPSPQFVPSRPHAPVGGPPACSGITATYLDCFTTSGVLGGNWANSTGANFTSTLSSNGSFLTTATASAVGSSTYSGGTFSAAQSSSIIFHATGDVANSAATGPCVRSDAASGNMYCYFVLSQFILRIANGGGVTTPVTGCPDPTGNELHEYKLIIDSGFNMTCMDATSPAGRTVTGVDANSTYPTGSPGIILDTRSNGATGFAKWGGS